MEVVILRTGHDLDVSDCAVIEQISVHVAVMLHVAGKQLAYDRFTHFTQGANDAVVEVDALHIEHDSALIPSP